MIKWNATEEERSLVVAIGKRAVQMQGMTTKNMGAGMSPVRAIAMDLVATHLNGCPLDLKGLLEAGPRDFTHDVWGIMEHIDRRTGRLKDCFTPRYARTK